MKAAAAIAVAWILSAACAWAQQEIVVHFPRGTTGAILEGRIEGEAHVDYKVGIAAGQVLHVSLETESSSAYFNVLEPDATDEPLFNGAVSGGEFEATLDRNGHYTVRVYLLGNAARRPESADYKLDIGVY